AAKPIASPIAVAMYPTLSVFKLTIGPVITAFFFIVVFVLSFSLTYMLHNIIDAAMKLHHLGKTVASRFELATAAVASVFLGFGSLFLLLASGVYV
ncbi:unnamed protein product, partial [Brassica napus]